MPKASKSTKPRTRTSAKSSDSTAELVLKAKVGDRSAENEIVRRSLPRLKRFAHGRLPSRVRHGYDTEDIVQDSMLHTLQRLSTFDPTRPGGLQAIFESRSRIACGTNAAGRSASVRRRPWPMSSTSGRRRSTRRRRRRSPGVSTSRREPPSADRSLLVARIDLGYDYKQIARLFDKPSPDAARVAVHRALRRAVNAAIEGDRAANRGVRP